MAKRMTVQSLAVEAETDIEEVIVTLWDLGLDDVEDPGDEVPRQWQKRCRAALGVDTPRQQKSVDYWVQRTGLSREELAATLAEVGISLPPGVRRLPKGALAKLRRRFAYISEPTTAEVEELEPCPSNFWSEVGQRRPEICYLEEADLAHIHEVLVADFAADDDPISPPGVKSPNLLSSALTRPRTSIGAELKYPTVELAGAALVHSLVMNHPFHNGNKRTGLVALLVFLDANGLMPTCDEKALFRLVLRIAQHGLVPIHCPELPDREVHEIALWIRSNSRRIEKGERPLPWHRLRRILRGFGCESSVSSSVGNRINISREVPKRTFLGRRSGTRTLTVQVAYGDEGRTVERNTLNHIRAKLELDEAHGYDSKVFYEAEALPGDFVQQYRTLLRRLSKL